MPRTHKEEDDKRQKLYAKRLLQQQQSQQRQREKQLERLNDASYQQVLRDKQKAAQQRQAEKQRQRQREKLQDPEHQEKLRLKQQQQAKKQQAKAAIKNSPTPKAPTPQALEKKRLQQQAMQQRMLEKQRQKLKHSPAKPAVKALKSKGLKGRAHTAEEKRLANKLAQIGCICCLNKGWTQSQDYLESGQNFISLHHVEGRVKPWAHAKVLPLCHYHHQTPAPNDAPAELFPLHGNAKPEWEKVNGTQESLLKQVYAMIEETRPWMRQDVAEPA